MTVRRKEYGWGRGLGVPPPREGTAARDCVLEGECRPSHKSRKSTRLWCRGKEGVPHQTEWVRPSTLPNAYHLQRAAGRRPETETERAARLERDGLGHHAEVLVCRVCQKQDLGDRYVCHCGVVMLLGKSRWMPKRCEACDYTPWMQRGKWINKQWVHIGPPRPKCRCELKKRRGKPPSRSFAVDPQDGKTQV